MTPTFIEPRSTRTIPYGVGSAHDVPPTPVTSPPADPRDPPVAHDASAVTNAKVINMLLNFFIYSYKVEPAPRDNFFFYIIRTLLWRLRFLSLMSSLRL